MYIKKKEMPNSFGRLYELVAKAAKVCRTWRLLFFTLYLSFLGKRAML